MKWVLHIYRLSKWLYRYGRESHWPGYALEYFKNTPSRLVLLGKKNIFLLKYPSPSSSRLQSSCRKRRMKSPELELRRANIWLGPHITCSLMDQSSSHTRTLSASHGRRRDASSSRGSFFRTDSGLQTGCNDVNGGNSYFCAIAQCQA